MLSDNQTIAISFILWPTFQFIASRIANKLPISFYNDNNVLFKTKKWEKGGSFYQTYFRIKSWKEYMPDSSFFNKNKYAKKRITDFSDENLYRFLIESRKAELVHILSVLPFWVWIIISRVEVMLLMLLYALIANIPCIIIQRYNRPRIKEYLNRRKEL
ncbi:MAG TPA: hypothetical protein VJ916_09350 [Anaerovoracaceae bacterium]|nr:hypothetical protein [Anaerovoracaceae bacterium]